MKIIRTDHFKKDFKALPESIRRRTEEALRLLVSNPHHPSLRVKKVRGTLIKGFGNVFEARITKNYRLFFLIEPGMFVLLCCGSHEDYLK